MRQLLLHACYAGQFDLQALKGKTEEDRPKWSVTALENESLDPDGG